MHMQNTMVNPFEQLLCTQQNEGQEGKNRSFWMWIPVGREGDEQSR
jgi:hypothetical protein